MPESQGHEGEEEEDEEEQVAAAAGLMQIGQVEVARQTYPPAIFNQALQQAKLLGWVDESVPEEPE